MSRGKFLSHHLMLFYEKQAEEWSEVTEKVRARRSSRDYGNTTGER
jgi:hypothetical protein